MQIKIGSYFAFVILASLQAFAFVSDDCQFLALKIKNRIMKCQALEQSQIGDFHLISRIGKRTACNFDFCRRDIYWRSSDGRLYFPIRGTFYREFNDSGSLYPGEPSSLPEYSVRVGSSVLVGYRNICAKWPAAILKSNDAAFSFHPIKFEPRKGDSLPGILGCQSELIFDVDDII